MSRDARRFFTTLGGAGNYFDLANINEADGDVANLNQSIGTWQFHSGSKEEILSSDGGARFGKRHLEWKATSTGQSCVRATADTTGSFPVSSSLPYSVSFDVKSPDGRLLHVIFRTFNAGGTPLTSTVLATDFSAPDWRTIRGTVTTDATAVFASVIVCGQTNGGAADDRIWLDRFMIAQGTALFWTPSIRLVGDIFMVFRGASANWAPGGGSANDQELLVNSDLSGDGFRFFVDNTGIPTAYHGNGTITRTESLNPANLIDGVAIEIAVWYDVSAGVATWYKDGLIDATDTFSAGAAVPHTDPLRVGSLDGTLRPFLGDVFYAAVHDGGPGSPIVARYDALHAFDKAESGASLVPDASTFRDDTGLGEWTSHGASVTALRDRKWDS